MAVKRIKINDIKKKMIEEIKCVEYIINIEVLLK